MNKTVKIGLGILAVAALGGLAYVGMNQTQTTKSGIDSELVVPKTLSIGLEGTYAPFSYRDKDGKLTGYEVELGTAIAKEMGLEPKFVETKFDALVAGLDAKKYDMVMNDMAISAEREKHYAFAEQYLYSSAVMITKQDSGIKSLADIKGKKAAQVASSNYGQAAKEAGAEIVSSPGFAESLDLIQSDRAAVSLNAEDSWGVYKKAHPKTNLTAIVTKDLEPSGAAPMLRKANTKELVAAVSKAEKQLKENGAMRKLSEKYFGQDLTKAK